MATMVHRVLQPCVESQFIEPTWPPSRIAAAHFKLASTTTRPPHHLPQPLELALKSCFLDLDSSSKSLDQRHDRNEILLSNSTAIPPKSGQIDFQAKPPMAPKKQQEQEPYVHQLVKRTLSEKSLALCTENLGNETGVDFLDGDDSAIFSDRRIEIASPTRKRVKSKSNSNSNQGNKKLFPPPLTTIAGIDAVRVRSYREDGRLIMEAVNAAPARLSYFQAERSHGRLRLSILKTTTPKFDSTEEEEEETNDDVSAVGQEGNCEKDPGGKVEQNETIQGVKIEIQKLQRPCRCCNNNNNNKAGKNNNNNNNNIDINNNNGMLLLTRDREPLSLWVATS